MSMAFCVQTERTSSTAKAAWRLVHDLRDVSQPGCVDEFRSRRNRVPIKPPTVREMKARAVARRAAASPRRQMKSSASFLGRGIISFGHDVQKLIRANQNLEDCTCEGVTDRLAEEFDREVLGHVIRGDESGTHAHFRMDADARRRQPGGPVTMRRPIAGPPGRAG